MPIEYPSYPFQAVTADFVGPCIAIGASDHDIDVPRVDSALADSLEVDAGNPWYSTDGYCLFSKDGTALIRCLTRMEHYEVPRSCTCIEDEAFAYNTVIRHVAFHDGITRIGDRAFIGSTLDSVELPGSVRSMGVECFAEGKNLTSVDLNEGLLEIGDGAFSTCEVLERVTVPASVRHLGNNAFSQCRIRAHGPQRGLSIDPANECYFIDDAGVLYRRDDDGLALMCALDQVSGDYAVREGTVRILGRAFAFNRRLERVQLPSGLKSIGKRAFLECERLESADLPEGVMELGAEAFYHSALKRLVLPSTLETLGPASLVVNIVIADQSSQTGVGGRGASDFYQTALSGKLNEVSVPRFDVEVSPGNARYTLEEGFLCERADGECGLRAVQYVGGYAIAVIPRSVTQLAEYAMFGVDNVRELHLHTGIERFGHSAINISYPLDLIVVDDGEDVPVRLYPAPNSSGTIAQRKAFRTGVLDLALLVRDCDASLSFMTPGDERTKRMLFRLANGRLLSDARKREFETTVSLCTDALIRHFSGLEHREGIRMMLDFGFIDGSSIAHAIEVANAAKGVACARLLLEEKRNRFPDRAFDFDL